MTCGQLAMGGCYHPDIGHSGPCWKTPRATCPKCGRTETPLTKDGRRFKDHFPRGGGVWCLGPSEEEMKNMDFYGDEDYDISTRTSRRADVLDAMRRSNNPSRVIKGEGGKMSTKIDALIRQAEAIQARLEEALEREVVFGSNDDYPVDAVLLFKRRFGGRTSRSYTYAAVKVSSGAWYVTGMNSNAYTFDELIDSHLMHADEVWFASEMTQLV